MIDWREARQRAGLSQTEVAKLGESFGWYQTTICNFETGKRRIEFFEGLFLCDLYGINLHFLQGDSHVVI